jgi:hypothetical protein
MKSKEGTPHPVLEERHLPLSTFWVFRCAQGEGFLTYLKEVMSDMNY